jgi:hypothetical protein
VSLCPELPKPSSVHSIVPAPKFCSLCIACSHLSGNPAFCRNSALPEALSANMAGLCPMQHCPLMVMRWVNDLPHRSQVKAPTPLRPICPRIPLFILSVYCQLYLQTSHPRLNRQAIVEKGERPLLPLSQNFKGWRHGSSSRT